MSLYLSLEEQSEHANFVGSYLKELCRILAPCWIWILFNFQLEHVLFSNFLYAPCHDCAYWLTEMSSSHCCRLWSFEMSEVKSQPLAIWDQRECVCVNPVCVSGLWRQFFYLQSKQLIPREKYIQLYPCALEITPVNQLHVNKNTILPNRALGSQAVTCTRQAWCIPFQRCRRPREHGRQGVMRDVHGCACCETSPPGRMDEGTHPSKRHRFTGMISSIDRGS